MEDWNAHANSSLDEGFGREIVGLRLCEPQDDQAFW
jgi:hypothetical protein